MSTDDTGNIPGTPSTSLNSTWVAYITPFAGAIGRTVEEVTDKLKGLLGDNPGELAIRALKNETMAPLSTLQAALTDIPPLVLAVAVDEHLRERAAPVIAAPPVTAMAGNVFNLLPDVPDDDQWLLSLKTTGVLYVGADVVIAGVKAALAKRAKMYEIPDKIVTRMLDFAKVNKRAVSPDYWKLRKMLTRRDYGDLFAAIEGVDGTYATEGRKREFLAAIEGIWSHLASFNRQLKDWNDLYIQTGSNPQALVSALTALTTGVRTAITTQYPPIAPLRDEAELVVNTVNEAFAGDGVPVAMALAWEAKGIREALKDPRLPNELGMANYEVMLRELSIDVTAADVRAEKTVVKFILSVMKLSEVDDASELEYVSELVQLGASIPWERLLIPTENPPAYSRNR